MGTTTKITTVCVCDWCGNKVHLDYKGVPSGWRQDIHFDGPGDLFCNEFDCRAEAGLFWGNAVSDAQKYTTKIYNKLRQEAVSKAKEARAKAEAEEKAEDGVHQGATG